MALRGTRPAEHAGSWYTADPRNLSEELNGWLEEASCAINGSLLPVTNARAVIAPHAGYRYSGPCAAWAYKCLDLNKARRVFVLGPSHTYYLRGCALTTFEKYATPFGDFQVDADVTARLRESGFFKDIPRHNDVGEHSLEMQLPYIWKMLERTLGTGARWPSLVPIIVGDGSGADEREFGQLLVPYLEDPENAFVISSDFCHWGRNFEFWHYCPSSDFSKIRSLSPRGDSKPSPTEPPVHEFIRVLDEAAFRAIETGSQAKFVDYLHVTENTVCGRHPISVAMAALELMGTRAPTSTSTNSPIGHPKFEFVRYERSDLAETTSDSSVSYGSAFAVF
ncbi:duf52 domain containing protein [Grosmannia clavigera kw1407]|uniref:Duf52 domain containing protein n=1 Tax=Grosmannia clavigera (strain kw1407 / UAMH 11150) TaxID=655863 RepID=F0XJX4_GROCL|nr:duf52 domain containing protein [Grosmannia clavigera kw1407]EFX01882.1 duf52 domain containing protein [Grosmannia clavigera kw1407]